MVRLGRLVGVPDGSPDWPEGKEWAPSRRWSGPGVGHMVAAAQAVVADPSAPFDWDPRQDAIIIARGWLESHDPVPVQELAATHPTADPGHAADLLYEELPDFSYLKGLPSLPGQAVARALGGCSQSLAVTSGWSDAVLIAGRLARSGDARQVLVVGTHASGATSAQLVTSASTQPLTPVGIGGVGAVTPLGADAQSMHQAMASATSGITRADWLTGLPLSPALGSIDPTIHATILGHWQQEHSGLDTTSALAHEVISQALEAATGVGPVGVVVAPMWEGAGGGDPGDWSRWFAAGADAQAAQEPLAHLAAELGERLGRQIRLVAVESTCAGGIRALDEACRMVGLGEVEEAVAVAVVARSNPYHVSQFAQLTALSRWRGEPTLASRPFDRERAGMVMGEAASAILVRGAEPGDVRVLGLAASHDHVHPTAPPPDSIRHAVEGALARAGREGADVDTINLHGTGTRLNDAAEDQALTALLGDRATELPVAACKSMTGHASSASSLLEVAVLADTLTTGQVPGCPTISEPDPELTLHPSPATAQFPELRVGLSTSFGFGGQYAAVVLGVD